MVFGWGKGPSAGRRGTRSTLLCLALALLPGCLDCFDGDELEASYRQGEASAREINDREFAHGYDDGLSLTSIDGEHDGDVVGYQDGYEAGYHGPFGYPRGVDDGYATGHTHGLLDPNACNDGTSRGQADGFDEGYSRGYDDAYAPTFDDGYEAGYADGANSCGFRSANGNADPEDMGTCKARGYERTLDRNAFGHGFDAGKADNPEYQAGYTHAYDYAYADGLGHGEIDGYDDGYFVGYDSGYIEGYDLSFYLCYDQVYDNGFDAGYGTGYDEGLSSGYDDGYDTGYDDGLSQCSE